MVLEVSSKDENYENMIWASPVKIIKMYLKKEINLN